MRQIVKKLRGNIWQKSQHNIGEREPRTPQESASPGLVVVFQILGGVRGRTLYGENENVFAFPDIMLRFLPNIPLQLFDNLPHKTTTCQPQKSRIRWGLRPGPPDLLEFPTSSARGGFAAARASGWTTKRWKGLLFHNCLLCCAIQL